MTTLIVLVAACLFAGLFTGWQFLARQRRAEQAREAASARASRMRLSEQDVAALARRCVAEYLQEEA